MASGAGAAGRVVLNYFAYTVINGVTSGVSTAGAPMQRVADFAGVTAGVSTAENTPMSRVLSIAGQTDGVSGVPDPAMGRVRTLEGVTGAGSGDGGGVTVTKKLIMIADD
jgi:hypothetical protein